MSSTDRRTDGQMDGRMDGQGESSIPPLSNFVGRGYNNPSFIIALLQQESIAETHHLYQAINNKMQGPQKSK